MRVIVAALFLALCASVGLPGTARASSAAVVYPTGNASLDVANVQTAVDGGGSVLLKSVNAGGVPTAFNFGPADFTGSWVTVLSDVDLEGETIASGAMTTVQGGWGPIEIFNGANVTIAGIRFASPFYEAIFAFNAGSVRIVSDRIEHVVGQPVDGFLRSAGGIEVGGGVDVTIADNVIDDLDAEFSNGIEQYGALGRVEISRNRITAFNTDGIEATQYTSRPGQGTSIHDNYIRTGVARYPRGAAGTPIEINGHGSYDVERNELVVDNPNGAAVFAFGFEQFRFGPVTGATIRHNTIRLNTEPFGAVGVAFLAEVSQAFVGQNQMFGVGFAALYTSGCACEPASSLDSDTFVGNDIGSLHSGFADVFFGTPTHHATLVGQSGTVVDLGTDDVITGFSAAGAGGVGKRFADTFADRFARGPQFTGPRSR